MEKLDIFGYVNNDWNSEKNNSDNKTENAQKTSENKSASEFASFVRHQTKENFHLNIMSHKTRRNSENWNVFRFDKLSKEETAIILAKNIININSDFVVMNKPNGIAVQDGGSEGISILEILNELSKQLKFKEPLQIVHRLDKDTTGALLLARNHDSAFKLKEAFKTGHIRKNYICLTNGIPHPVEGIIDFQLKEKLVDGKAIIKPDMQSVQSFKKGKTKSSSIATAYKILASNYNIALVQCSMISGVKHQIRAHLAYGLETPIIGDHKYSWLINSNKFPILPQTLSELALKGLQIEQGKVRNLPIHLHAHQIIIGNAPLPVSLFDSKADLTPGKNDLPPCRLKECHFYTNLPPFFVRHLKLLKMYDLRLLKQAIKNIL